MTPMKIRSIVDAQPYEYKGFESIIEVDEMPDGRFRSRWSMNDKEDFVCYFRKDTIKSAVALARKLVRRFVNEEMLDDAES